MDRKRVDEQVVMFGPDGRLVGVVTSPAADDSPASSPAAVVILNAGIIHRVGPGRLHVRLARMLAEAGHTVLRFDLPGIGDSPQYPGLRDYVEAIERDCRRAIDIATRGGAESVVIFGLCSGADFGFRVAAVDPRVEGLILVDPSVPVTRGYHLRWWMSRVANPGSWRSLLTGNSNLLARLRAGGDADNGQGSVTSEYYLGEAGARRLRDIVRRGVRFCCVFTGGQGRYNYRSQFAEAFPDVDFGDQLDLEYWPDCTHIFLSERDKLRLLAAVRDWMVDRELTPQPTAETEAVSPTAV